ncbi:MAG: hypothetical protein WC107_05570 [Patescibacteria group bacterium]
MAIDIEIIKRAIEPLPSIFKDIYIGNGEPPLRDTCREYLAEKKCKETAKTEAIKEKKDFKGKFILQIIGAFIAFTFGQFALFLAAINWMPQILALITK